MSVLAVAGEAGISRDRLVGILWPDVEPRRARHSLTQALYAARKALACDDLFAGAEDLRLNAGRITTDVEAFERALAGSDYAAAVDVYRGPFLDGFYFSSSEFDRWLEGHRLRYDERVVAALQSLISTAESAADYATAAQRLGTLAALRPLDASVTLRLMQAHIELGDAAAAIQRAERYRRILREEYEAEPDPSIIALADELRRSPPPPAVQPSINSVAEPIVREPIEVASITVNGRMLEHGRRIDIRRRVWPVLSFLLVATLALAIGKDGWLTPRIDPLGERIVVAPFRTAGADPSLHFLREGMVELLSTRLADDSAARPIDGGAVIRAWRRAGVSRSDDVSDDTVVSLAAQLGAERVIVGSIVGTPARAVMRASIISPASGVVSAQASVEGPTDSLTALVDRLAGRLLASQAGNDPPLAELTTTSLPALRAFLAGAQSYAAGNYRIASDRFARALALDSMFGLAAFRLVLSARRMSDFPLERTALEHAWRLRDDLSASDRLHLEALAGPRYPEPSVRGELIAAWEQAAREAPDRSDVWYEYAAHLSESAGYHPQGLQRDHVLAALDRATALDPAFVQPHLLRIRLGEALPRYARDRSVLLRWREAERTADTVQLAQIADTLPTLGPATLRLLTAVAQFDGVGLGDAGVALAHLRRRTDDLEQSSDLLMAEHGLALLRGRMSSAFDFTRRMQRQSPVTRTHLRLRILDAVFAEGDTAVAREAVRELERSLQTREPASVMADACALAQWYIARGDTAGIRRALQTLNAGDGAVRLVAAAPRCLHLAEAGLAVAEGQPNARLKLLQADSLALATTVVGDVASYAHILLARLHRRFGDHQRAFEAIRRRPYLTAVWPRYRATALLEEARLAELVGDSTSAISAYTRYLELRSEPDSALRPATEAVRGLLHGLPGARPKSR